MLLCVCVGAFRAWKRKVDSPGARVESYEPTNVSAENQGSCER